jgi:hypothetical protein
MTGRINRVHLVQSQLSIDLPVHDLGLLSIKYLLPLPVTYLSWVPQMCPSNLHRANGFVIGKDT